MQQFQSIVIAEETISRWILRVEAKQSLQYVSIVQIRENSHLTRSVVWKKSFLQLVVYCVNSRKFALHKEIWLNLNGQRCENEMEVVFFSNIAVKFPDIASKIRPSKTGSRMPAFILFWRLKELRSSLFSCERSEAWRKVCAWYNLHVDNSNLESKLVATQNIFQQNSLLVGSKWSAMF